MTKPRLYSGMQPSADSLQLGNYIGALLPWKNLQDTHEAIFSVVDLHALTQPHKPDELREKIRRTAAQYIAAGIEPSKSILYVQSRVAAHAELQWALSTITGFGEASRMTQFKDKSARYGEDGTKVGLFTYPILMAADILLYQSEVVPVGADQKQHVELTRDLAQKFNKRFGHTFTVPSPLIPGETARIYDLQQPTQKMSKSAETDLGTIWVLDEPELIAKKIRKATADSEGAIYFDRESKPGVSNLMVIHSALSGKSLELITDEFQGKGYGALKAEVTELVVNEFEPIRFQTKELLADSEQLDEVLADNAERARAIAELTRDAMAENDVHIEIEGGYNINRVTFNELSTGKEVGYLKMAHMDERSLTRSFGDDEWQVFAWADEARGGSFGFSQYKSPKLDDFTKETKLRENLSPEERLEAKRKLWASSHKALGQLPAGFDRSLLTWGDPINLKPENSPASEEALDKDIDKLRTILSRELAHKIEWHGTPNIDYIRLAPELQGAGMGHALYVFGARRQAKDGKAIRASGIQTPEAQKSWNRMKKAGLPVKDIEIPVNDDGSKELKSGKLLDFR